MGYAWASRDRLCPMRMVSDRGHHDRRFEISALERRFGFGRRKHHNLNFMRPDAPLFEIMRVRMSPGRLGEWPVFKYGKRKRK